MEVRGRTALSASQPCSSHGSTSACALQKRVCPLAALAQPSRWHRACERQNRDARCAALAAVALLAEHSVFHATAVGSSSSSSSSSGGGVVGRGGGLLLARRAAHDGEDAGDGLHQPLRPPRRGASAFKQPT
jgi:hypothetical protein